MHRLFTGHWRVGQCAAQRRRQCSRKFGANARGVIHRRTALKKADVNKFSTLISGKSAYRVGFAAFSFAITGYLPLCEPLCHGRIIELRRDVTSRNPISFRALGFMAMKWVASLPLLLWGFTCFGQTNRWVSSAGGNWQDVNSWSAGVLPGTNQTILITNAGSKAVRIGAETSETHPASLSVGGITVGGVVDAVNTLHLDFA